MRLLLCLSWLLSVTVEFVSAARVAVELVNEARRKIQIARSALQQEQAICTPFLAHAMRQQCVGRKSLDKLGTLRDRVACAEACARSAIGANATTCCVHTDLGTCVAYIGASGISNISLFSESSNQNETNTKNNQNETNKQKTPYRGSATLCTLNTTIAADAGLEQREFNNTRMISPHGEALFRNIRPCEIKQGSLGDCWLMAAIASMARFPGATRKLFMHQFRTSDGRYNVQLYNPNVSRWVWVSVDDKVPIHGSYHMGVLHNDPIYAKLSSDHTTWVLLLEKAVALLVAPAKTFRGKNRSVGYSKLHRGYVEFAHVLLTGAQKHTLWAKCRNSTSLLQSRSMDFVRNSLKNVWPKRIHWFYARKGKAWRALLDGTQNNRLMSGTVAKSKTNKTTTCGECTLLEYGRTESKEKCGLYGNHAYSILQAREFVLTPERWGQSANASTKVCEETIIVTYNSRRAWKKDSTFMKKVWWRPDGEKRFTGATWKTSKAAQWGVAEGWRLLDSRAFEGAPPTKSQPRKASFRGIVDAMACDRNERRRSGRTTETVSKQITSLALGKPLRFVQVRNPWGTAEMWTGAWSDTDRLKWQSHPDIAEALAFAPLADGMWWMSFEDFADRFARWSIGGVDMLKFEPSE